MAGGADAGDTHQLSEGSVTIRYATGADVLSLLPLSDRANREGAAFAMPIYAQHRYLTALCDGTGRGFVLMAEEAGVPVGLISCEYQQQTWTGHITAYLSSFATCPDAPLKLAHRLLKDALSRIFFDGISAVVLSTSVPNPHPAYEALGAKPMAIFYQGDVAEGLARLEKRGV